VLSSKATENASNLSIFSFKLFFISSAIISIHQTTVHLDKQIFWKSFFFSGHILATSIRHSLINSPLLNDLECLAIFFGYHKAGFDSAVVLWSLLVEHLLLGIQVLLQLLYFIFS
jgi:hypothetical protein